MIELQHATREISHGLEKGAAYVLVEDGGGGVRVRAQTDADAGRSNEHTVRQSLGIELDSLPYDEALKQSTKLTRERLWIGDDRRLAMGSSVWVWVSRAARRCRPHRGLRHRDLSARDSTTTGRFVRRIAAVTVSESTHARAGTLARQPTRQTRARSAREREMVDRWTADEGRGARAAGVA